MWVTQARQQKQTKSSVPQIVDKPVDNDLNENDDNKNAQIRTVYCLAKYS